METRKIFKCFISSPGDCQTERVACQEIVGKINIGLAKHLGISFETFMWEYDVLPDMGSDGQEVIDEYIRKSNYDIFIGIMKNKFGHATKKAGSGTEHEFIDALQRKKDSPDSFPKILFFFGKEQVDPNNFDFLQFEKVKDFKSRISSQGLYNTFEDNESFKKSLTQKLELFIAENSPMEKPKDKIQEVDIILKKLELDLDDSLRSYNEKSPIWIDPILSSKKEIPNSPNKNDEYRIEIKSITNNPKDIIVKAPSEFGLTSLGHFIKLEAWKCGKTFLYIDSKATKKHKIVRDILRTAETYFFKKANHVDCIIIDSVCFEENGIMQIIKNVCDEFKNIPLIILNTLDNNFFLKSDEDDKVEIKRSFTSYYLLPLPQNDVRKIVTSYTHLKSVEQDDDIILNRVTKDLEVLNLHRTPKNCLSLIRAAVKIGSEYNPINRTKLLEIILNTVFEEYEIPTYHDKKPDIKDCNFVLGYFCELLVLRSDFEFDANYFKTELKKFCESSFIDLDLNYLLNLLSDNSIIGKNNYGLYYFKNSYWVFYFIAQRMNMNKIFLENVYANKRYVDFPEIIEFYTGIDRNKEDAIRILTDDLTSTINTVKLKVNISDNLNPFKSITWSPNIPSLEKEEAKISENVISSGLPDEVKDKYEDKHYNQKRPYNQVINSVIRDYSFLVLFQQISATSRALRNSDFVDSNLKKELLDKIILGWNEVNKILIILAPLLADKGNVAFEGAKFYLEEGAFNMDDPDKKRLAVLLALPSNIVKFFKDDLFSSKMGPLLVNKAETETNSLLKHELMLLIIAERPRAWNKIVDNYIVSLDKNSFYLSDVLYVLNFQKDYKTTEIDEKRIIELLAKKCRAKHLFNNNNPDIGLINRIKKLEDKGLLY